MNKQKMGILIVMVIAINILLFKIVLSKQIDLVEVPYAIDNIVPRSKIDDKMIAIKKVPSVYVDENVIKDKEELISKYTQIEGMIPKGSIFYKNMVFSKEVLPDYPSLNLNKGESAYQISSDLLKLAGNSIVRGQHVDLYATITQKKDKPIVGSFISNVRILAIKDRKGLDTDNKDSNGIPYVVVVALKNEQIKYAKVCSKIGTIDIYATKEDNRGSEAVLGDPNIIKYLSNE
ncbi:MAG: RcpC/CpaB family pilus assembly protein [Erysipelotrichaceae bacterium]